MKKLLFLFSVLVISSCTKIEDLLIGGNTLPPDYTIENTTIENYINKLYISTIGREPTDTEFSTDFDILRSTNLSQSNREIVIDGLLNKAEYYNNLFILESEHLLLGADTADINQNIHVLNVLLSNSQGLDSIYFAENLARMMKLQEVLPGLVNGTILNIEMHKRMVDNSFYDEINMGTENFVVSMFQNFINRYPTMSELQSGKTMVDGGNASIFLVSGNKKADFINIFLESDEYFTGQTNILFNRYLFRAPTSEESINFSLDYINTQDYQLLQSRILSSNEFIGL